MIGTGVALAAWQARSRAAAAQPSFVTEPVTRGALSVTVSANGTLQPTRAVNIGSELSGTVARVLVDVNDRVKKGQVLVELDTAKLRDQITRSRAAVASAQAGVAQAVATFKEAQGNLARLEEVSRLSGGKVLTRSDSRCRDSRPGSPLTETLCARAASSRSTGTTTRIKTHSVKWGTKSQGR